MGIDCRIAFEVDGPEDVYVDVRGFDVCDGGLDEAPGSTHHVDTDQRYYGPGYERGPAYFIVAVLMQLWSHKNVKRVWYGTDVGEDLEEISPEGVLALAAHYMKFAHRPYDDSFKR